MEPAPRVDGRAHDDELRPPLGRDPGHLLAEVSRPRPDHLSPYRDAVRIRHRGRGLEPLFQDLELPVEVRVDRQLALEDGGRHQDDPGAAVGGEPAGQIERVLGLLPVEQRHDDGAIGDRARPAGKAPRATVQDADVGQPHRMSWYGTEARITCGSTSSRRFT